MTSTTPHPTAAADLPEALIAHDELAVMSARFEHQPGEVLGSQYPSWPEDLDTFALRAAYQHRRGRRA